MSEDDAYQALIDSETYEEFEAAVILDTIKLPRGVVMVKRLGWRDDVSTSLET